MNDHRAWRVAALVMLAILAGTLSWRWSQPISSALGEAKLRNGFSWFGEPLRVQRFVERELDQELLSIATPFEPLIVRAPVRMWLRVIPGRDPLDVLRGFTALGAGLWAALVFAALSALGCRLIDAVLFTLIGIASAAAQLWFAVPSAKTFGSVSTLFAVLLVLSSETPRVGRGWPTTLAVMASLGVRLVNGVFGVIAAGLMHGWRRGLQLVVNGVCVLLLLWPVQRILYPASGPSPALVSAAPARLVTAIVDAAIVPVHSIVITDHAAMLRGGVGHSGIGLLGVAAWLGLLALGVSQIVKGHRRLGMFLWVVLAARLLAGRWNGEPSFDAALDILPLLLIAGAAATLTPHRRTCRLLGVVVLAAMLVNQRTALDTAIALLGDLP